MLGGNAVVDLHCHILPGVDDGSDEMSTSLEMAAMAADCGVKYIFATPHCNTRNEQKNFRTPALLAAVDSLQAALDRNGIPVRILPGAEVLIRGRFTEHLEQGDFMTLNASRYLLVEFYFDEHPNFMEQSLRQIENAGLVPVVAHPERYYCVQDSPALALGWAERGRVLQLNKGSILGNLGEGSYDAATQLLRLGAASVIASDAHHFLYRTPHMGRLLEELEQRFPQLDPGLLLRTNPAKIAMDQRL